MNKDQWKAALNMYEIAPAALSSAVSRSIKAHQSIIEAWINGADVEIKDPDVPGSWQYWEDVISYSFDTYMEYRVKAYEPSGCWIPPDWVTFLEAYPRKREFPWAAVDSDGEVRVFSMEPKAWDDTETWGVRKPGALCETICRLSSECPEWKNMKVKL